MLKAFSYFAKIKFQRLNAELATLATSTLLDAANCSG
jgi:hypothetical protein